MTKILTTILNAPLGWKLTALLLLIIALMFCDATRAEEYTEDIEDHE